MTKNPLNPVRYPDETLPEYRARRKSANEAAQREIQRSSHQSPGGGGSRKRSKPAKDSGQHPKLEEPRKRNKPPGLPFAGAKRRLLIPRLGQK